MNQNPREELYNRALVSLQQNKSIALEWATGIGKTKATIDLVNSLHSNIKILLLVAKTVHKQNWTDEITKWGGIKGNVTIECYESLKKHLGETFDIVIADEAHHLKSELRQDYFSTLIVNEKLIFLSATFPRELKAWLKIKFNTQFIKASLQKAINADILPTPNILLVPLTLDNKNKSEVIELNPKVKGMIHKGNYSDYWKYKLKKVHAMISVTPFQYMNILNKDILYWKNLWERNHRDITKFKWLQLCNKRLLFLANCKNNFVKKLLKQLANKRTLTFCKSIEQTEELGKHCIHSKNSNAQEELALFNAKKIKHITSCQVLNEGVNLTDCEYCIFANLNSSETLQIQRIGRSLRHKHPKIIIPYYKDTREEEIVNKMIEGYDKKLIHTYKYENRY